MNELAQSPTWAPGYRHRTVGVPPVSFRFREELEDFQVKEIGFIDYVDEGDHLHLWIEKRGITTAEAARAIATALDRPPESVGYAGLKDAKSVSRQWLSIEHADIDDARRLELEKARVLDVRRHKSKLRVGQLAGNRFRIVLRGLAEFDRPQVEAVLATLSERGLPNYYGAQRFGRSGLTYELGRFLAQGRHEEYLAALVSPDHAPANAVTAELARVLREGSWRERRALGVLAHLLDADLAALAVQIARRPKSPEWGVRAISKGSRRFHLSALQARVFNRVLSNRMAEPGGIDDLWEGDLVQREGRGGTFLASEPRSDVPLRLSATGPMPGTRVATPAGRTAEIEAEALAEEEVTPEMLSAIPGGLAPHGSRRPLRVRVADLELDFEGDRAILAFRLPRGSYATTLLEELLKEHG